MPLMLEDLMGRRVRRKSDEPVEWAVAVSSCPLCRTRLIDGICPACARRLPTPARKAKARTVEARPPIDLRSAAALAVSFGSLAICAVSLLGSHATALPSRQGPAASPTHDPSGMIHLVQLADALDDVAVAAQRHLVEETNTSAAEVGDLLQQVNAIESQLNDVSPAQDGNRGAAWNALSQSCGQLRATIASFRGLTPDVDGQGIAYVRGRLKKTRALLEAAPGAAEAS